MLFGINSPLLSTFSKNTPIIGLDAATKASVWEWYPDAFGVAKPSIETVKMNLRFPGQYYDATTGLHYNLNLSGTAAQDNPMLGRYMEPDPIGLQGGWNPYVYAGNDPVNNIDASGLIIDTVWDVGNMAYDLGKIVLGSIKGNNNWVKEGKIDLALDTAAATIPFVPAGASKAARVVEKTAIWSSTKNKTAVENAFGHWQKHKGEFPEIANAKQYAERTKDFLNNPPAGSLTKTNAKGDTLRYDANTNTFGVLSKDGSPRTMFRPTDKINYWNRQ